MIAVGTNVTFGRRSGQVRGHVTLKRKGYASETDTYLVVELDNESAAYLQPREGLGYDCFISMMIVHPESVGKHTEIVGRND